VEQEHADGVRFACLLCLRKPRGLECFSLREHGLDLRCQRDVYAGSGGLRGLRWFDRDAASFVVHVRLAHEPAVLGTLGREIRELEQQGVHLAVWACLGRLLLADAEPTDFVLDPVHSHSANAIRLRDRVSVLIAASCTGVRPSAGVGAPSFSGRLYSTAAALIAANSSSVMYRLNARYWSFGGSRHGLRTITGPS
jgi:hypothetical protein